MLLDDESERIHQGDQSDVEVTAFDSDEYENVRVLTALIGCIVVARGSHGLPATAKSVATEQPRLSVAVGE